MNLSFAGIAFWGGRGACSSMAIDLCSPEERKNEAGSRSLYAIQQAITRTVTTNALSTFHGRFNQGMRSARCIRIVASMAGSLGIGDSQPFAIVPSPGWSIARQYVWPGTDPRSWGNSAFEQSLST